MGTIDVCNVNGGVVMNGKVLVCMLAATAVMSGCAGGPGKRDMSRVQSQLNLLEDRVTQLERSNTEGGPSASLMIPEPAAVRELASASGSSQDIANASSNKIFAKPSVREIQQSLKNAGFYQGAIDGKTGPMTKEAIREFQRVHGLKDDGVVGKQTWAKLSTYQDMTGSGATAAADMSK